MSAPRIVAAVRYSLGRFLIDEYGERYSYNWLDCGDAVNARLMLSGQRAVWPDGFGVAELVDLPPKLPETYAKLGLYVNRSPAAAWLTCEVQPRTPDLVVWIDADGVPHVERVP